MSKVKATRTNSKESKHFLFKTLGAYLVLGDNYSNNWISVQFDNSHTKKPPRTILSPFYHMISIPQTIHNQNTQSFILTYYTPKTGEISRIVSRENIDNEMKKLLMLNLLIEPHILYKDPSLDHHDPLCYTIPSLVQKN
tara:strand:+ start:171 stop:587 length:417 start_codon:yes stop_codon:yes gene_type:complete